MPAAAVAAVRLAVHMHTPAVLLVSRNMCPGRNGRRVHYACHGLQEEWHYGREERVQVEKPAAESEPALQPHQRKLQQEKSDHLCVEDEIGAACAI